jgi:PKD repeat protein
MIGLVACGGGEGDKAPAPAPAAKPTPPPTAAPSEPAADADDNEAEPLSIFLDANVIEGKAPLTVIFKVDIDGGTLPLKWKWDYGNGASSDAAETEHTYVYEKPGVFLVELEVEDSAGDSDFDILEIEVFEK